MLIVHISLCSSTCHPEPNLQVDDEYTADYVYVDSSFDDLYERSLVPMISRDDHGAPGFMEGIDCCVITFGAVRSGKTYTAHGSGPAASDGVVPMCVQGIFEAIEEKLEEARNAKKKTHKWRHKLSMQFIEVVDEKIVDLLNPQKVDLDVDEVGLKDGLGIHNLSRQVVDTAKQLMQHFRVGQAARTTARTEWGPLRERSTAILNIELHQVMTSMAVGGGRPHDEHLFSRFMVIDLPGAEKLSEDPTTLRIREGPTLNNGIMAFGSIVKALHGMKDVTDTDFIDFKQSKVTAMLPEVLGGNCRTLIITTIQPADYKSNTFVLEFSQLFRSVRQFPVVNSRHMIALLRKQNNIIDILKRQLAALGFGKNDNHEERATNQLLEIHKLEKKIIDDERVRLNLLEEREQLREKIMQLNSRVNQLLADKAQLQQERILAEEERLKVSKVLVDLQIENTSLLEAATDKEFQLENKLLQQENDVMELEMAAQSKQKRIDQLEKERRADLQLIQDLKNELSAVRNNYTSVLSDLDSEKARCEELSVELLNLVNAKNALMRERGHSNNQRESLLKMNQQLEARMTQAETDLKAANEKAHNMSMASDEHRQEVSRAKLELETMRIKYEEQRLLADRKLHAFEQGKGEETLGLRREMTERMEESKAAVKKLEDEIALVTARYKQASRRAGELETELNDKAGNEADIQNENLDLKQRMTQLSESYREKLHKYISDVSHLSTTVTAGSSSDSTVLSELRAAVDSMFQELVNTYGQREMQFMEEIKRSREHNMSIIKKNRRLYQAYRSLRYQLEDLAPKGINIQVLDEGALQVDGDIAEIEKQQHKVLDELRDKLTAAEHKMISRSEKSLREAEKYTAQATQLQSKLAGQTAELTALKQRLVQMEDEKREQQGELQRLQQQLLSEITSLKAKGIAAQPVLAAPVQDLSREVGDLRRQLDTANQENDRLRSDVQRLRNAPPPAAPSGGGAEADSLRSQLGDKQRELDSLRGQLQTAQAEAKRCKDEAESLKAQLAAASKGGGGGGGGGGPNAAQAAEIEALKKKVKELDDELSNDDLKAMISNFAQGTQGELEAEVSELRTNNTMLETEVEELRATVMRLQKGG